MKTMLFVHRLVVSLLLLAMAAATPLSAAPAKRPLTGGGAIVPCPPEFVLDKQLPGEDPYWIYRPTFSPDVKMVAAYMSGTKKIVLWDIASGKVVKEIGDDVHGMDALDGLEWTRDGKQLILLRSDKPMKWLDWNAGKITRQVELNADPKKILDYAFNADQSRLAVATYSGVKYWDVVGGKQLKEFMKGKVVCAVDMVEYMNKAGQKVRMLAWGRAIMPPDTTFKGVAGLVNLDSGAATALLEDVPADKKIEGKTTFLRVKFDTGGALLLVGCYVIPPSVNAAVFLVDGYNGKYLGNNNLGQLTIDYDIRYLGKPFWGYLVATADMRNQEKTATATQFLVPTRNEGLKIIDTVTEDTMATQSLWISPGAQYAAVTLKKNQMDPSKLYIYKLVPKKK